MTDKENHVITFKGKTAKAFVQNLYFLSRLSPFARILIEADTKAYIYAVERSERAAAIVKMKDIPVVKMDNVFRVSSIPKLITKLSFEKVEITKEGIFINSFERRQNNRVYLKLKWVNYEYPPLPPLKLPYRYIFRLEKRKIQNVLDLFSLLEIDELKITVHSRSITLQGVGSEMLLTIPMSEHKSGNNDVEATIAVYIPSSYAKLIHTLLKIADNILLQLHKNKPLLVTGVSSLAPSKFEISLIISSRHRV